MQRILLHGMAFLYLTGCNAPFCRQWEIQEILTQSPSYNAGRILLGPDSTYSKIDLELTRSQSGLRFYFNLLFLRAPPWKEDPSKSTMEIIFQGKGPWTIHPYLFEGGQRLLVSGEDADLFVQALLNNESFTATIGRSSMTVIPTNFSTVYTQLLALPIDENDPKSY